MTSVERKLMSLVSYVKCFCRDSRSPIGPELLVHLTIIPVVPAGYEVAVALIRPKFHLCVFKGIPKASQ